MSIMMSNTVFTESSLWLTGILYLTFPLQCFLPPWLYHAKSEKLVLLALPLPLLSGRLTFEPESKGVPTEDTFDEISKCS